MSDDEASRGSCPACGHGLVRPSAAEVSWCPACEWNLREYDRTMAPFRGLALISRWGFRRGLAVDRRLRSALSSDPDSAPVTSRGGRVLVLISLVVLLLALALLAGAAALLFATDLPVVVRLLLALPLIGVALMLAPSPTRIPASRRLADEQAPQFRRVVADVAACVGSAPPDVIVFDLSVNAGVTRMGWRRRSVLIVGMPLWLMLTPEMRVSLLAHEFGHLVNGDPMRATLTLPARTLGDRAVAATGGRNPWSRAAEGVDSAADSGAGIAAAAIHGALALINTMGATVQLLIDSTAMPDSRRAEFHADLIARRVGGTDAFVSSEDRLLLAQSILDDLWDRAPRIGPEELAAAISSAASNRAGELPALRQASVRSNDLWSSHPAAADRMGLMNDLPRISPSLVVAPDRWAAADVELSAWRDLLHRTLLGTRDPIRTSPGA